MICDLGYPIKIKGHGLLKKHNAPDGIPQCQCGKMVPTNLYSPVYMRDWHRQHKREVAVKVEGETHA